MADFGTDEFTEGQNTFRNLIKSMSSGGCP